MADLSIQHLLRDHQHFDGVLAELEALFDLHEPAATSEVLSEETYSRLARFVREELDCHLRKEDEALFPALEAFLPRDDGPLAVLSAEHEELRARFNQLLEAIEFLSRESDRRKEIQESLQHRGPTTVRILRDHIYKEGRVLFPLVARLLSTELDFQILKKMEAIERTSC